MLFEVVLSIETELFLNFVTCPALWGIDSIETYPLILYPDTKSKINIDIYCITVYYAANFNSVFEHRASISFLPSFLNLRREGDHVLYGFENITTSVVPRLTQPYNSVPLVM